jgi:hypothetical protein
LGAVVVRVGGMSDMKAGTHRVLVSTDEDGEQLFLREPEKYDPAESLADHGLNVPVELWAEHQRINKEWADHQASLQGWFKGLYPESHYTAFRDVVLSEARTWAQYGALLAGCAHLDAVAELEAGESRWVTCRVCGSSGGWEHVRNPAATGNEWVPTGKTLFHTGIAVAGAE